MDEDTTISINSRIYRLLNFTPPDSRGMLRLKRDSAFLVGAVAAIFGGAVAKHAFGKAGGTHALLLGLTFVVAACCAWTAAAVASAARDAAEPADAAADQLAEIAAILNDLRRELASQGETAQDIGHRIADLGDRITDLDRRFRDAEVSMKSRMETLGSKEDEAIDGIRVVATALQDEVSVRRNNKGG